MKPQVKCTQCGWTGDADLTDNGKHEPPTCHVCDMPSLITVVPEDTH